jgi:hypothetical protein
MWTMTGIIMVWPGRTRERGGDTPIDLSKATLSPAEVMSRLSVTDSITRVRGLAVLQILDQVVYQVQTRRGSILINAGTGDRYSITPDVAWAIALQGIRGAPGSVRVEHLTEYDARYSSGDLPVYRVTVGDAASTVKYVSERDGSVVSSDSRRRFRAAAGKLHDFSAIKMIFAADWLHRGLAITVCFVAIGGILTGYWLAVPAKKPPARVRSTMPVSRQP